MTLRDAVPDDLGAIMALERASFPTDAWSDAMMREELSSPHGWYIVDEEGPQLLGYAGLRAPRGSKDADVQTIAIAEAARGQGRGRVILSALLHEAARRRVREVFLEVRADNPVAQGLYASEGFVELGRRPHYYQPDDIDAVIMRLVVADWVAARERTSEPGPTSEIGRNAEHPAGIAPTSGGSPAFGERRRASADAASPASTEVPE
ncbi:ribosomal protein S18-alanine N-acetyltransferase [Microbacterium sp. P01]|uniref:ribosomal protein S18-alanine N-acetyltransferase n=1 Tax=Microbacterium sp. P01 TaxID=3366261 RepID=UPI00366B8EFD